MVRDIHYRKHTQTRLALLTKLSALVGISDPDQLAEALVQVPIPELGDWCTVNLLESGRIRRTFVANRDPSKTPLRDAIVRTLPAWDRHPLWQELLTGGFQLLTEVSDDLLPANAGRWRLQCPGPADGGQASCERTTAAADIALPVAALGAGYLGGTRLGALAAAGLITEHKHGALARLSAAMYADPAPWCPSMF